MMTGLKKYIRFFNQSASNITNKAKVKPAHVEIFNQGVWAGLYSFWISTLNCIILETVNTRGYGA